MKRLVVCCDGTWQRLYGDHLTNVALTARAVKSHADDGISQIVYYDEGVGAGLDHLSLWRGMTGDDLDERLLEAYQFLTLNYEPGDQIFLFGFSRGAYTVRSLAGLVRRCGVLRREHADKGRAALQLYRTKTQSADSEAVVKFRRAHAAAWPNLDPAHAPPPCDLRIRYVGVWDTVGALGVPRLLPFALGRDRRYEFHDTDLSRAVQGARHAVAIDERRASFTPALWSNLPALNPLNAAPRVEQAWFPGDHGAVGGGPARALSNCALLWVLEGAERAGLAFAREPGSVLSACRAEIDPINGPIKSRAASVLNLLGARWRRGPKTFDDVHETARLRWAANRAYRPAPLRRFRDRILDAVAQ